MVLHFDCSSGGGAALEVRATDGGLNAHVWMRPVPNNTNSTWGYLPFQSLNEVHTEPVQPDDIAAVFYLNLTSTVVPFKSAAVLEAEAGAALDAANELAAALQEKWNRRIVPVVQLNGLEHGYPGLSVARSKAGPDHLPEASRSHFLPPPR